MKQILQSLASGETKLVDVPCPQVTNGSLLISTRASVVSSGTERMLVDFGKANIVNKARQQPDKVKMVLDKVKTDGLLSTLDAVRSKLDQPLPLGYCNAGVVLESGATGFKQGDRVVSNGHHAEVVRVPQNLCAKIPDEVDDESAAFTVLGAIGLQGIRLVNPTLGETIVVFGLGLIGLMTVQMLRANGCRVIGIDFDSSRCALAQQFGADTVDLSKGQDPLSIAQQISKGRGVDAVIIAASSQSDDIVHQAAEMCRKKGRIVLVGVVGLNLRRDDFFEKELTFQVSASYGPGRYDPRYEEQGQDYPIGYVRWTEQRNFEAVLDMMARGQLDVKALITHRYQIQDAIDAYSQLDDKAALGILLNYPSLSNESLQQACISLPANVQNDVGKIKNSVSVGFIGAGNYASRVLIPKFKEAGAMMHTIVSSAGLSGVHHGSKAGFQLAATDLQAVLDDQSIHLVTIATQHHQHAEQVIAALQAGKHVFVEKPLALTLNQLAAIDTAYQQTRSSRTDAPLLMVGFNRRFAPHVLKMKHLLERKNEPKVFVMTVNAGEIPASHWTQDATIGGGRIIGEACHFVDLMRFLVGHKITDFKAMAMGEQSGMAITRDKVTISLSFDDGSLGTIHYLANGGKAFAKERIEVFCGNSVLQLDNYRVLKGFDWPGFNKLKLWRQDKGQKACVRSLLHSIHTASAAPIPYDELMESSRVSIEINESLL